MHVHSLCNEGMGGQGKCHTCVVERICIAHLIQGSGYINGCSATSTAASAASVSVLLPYFFYFSRPGSCYLSLVKMFHTSSTSWSLSRAVAAQALTVPPTIRAVGGVPVSTALAQLPITLPSSARSQWAALDDLLAALHQTVREEMEHCSRSASLSLQQSQSDVRVPICLAASGPCACS